MKIIIFTCYENDWDFKLRILCDKDKIESAKLLLEFAIEKEQKLSSYVKIKKILKKIRRCSKKNKILITIKIL